MIVLESLCFSLFSEDQCYIVNQIQVDEATKLLMFT